MGKGPLRVVFIVGTQRSGSTLLGNLLGELDGFFDAGELRNLWERSLVSGSSRCGCGVPLSECTLWSQAIATALDTDDPQSGNADGAAVRRWQQQTIRSRQLWHRVLDRDAGSWEQQAYLRVMDRLYHTITELTGARIVVDTSKSSPYAAAVSRLPGIVPHYVHLVRDPRGVVYSRQRGWKSWQRPAGAASPALGRLTVVRVVGSWARSNLAAELLTRRGGDRALRVRYEDLMARPRAILESIAGLVGESPVAFPLEDAHTVRLGVQHTAAGNPSRFRTGTLSLREDRAWRTALSASDQRLASALAFPLMRHYGYSLRPAPAQADAPTG